MAIEGSSEERRLMAFDYSLSQSNEFGAMGEWVYD